PVDRQHRYVIARKLSILGRVRPERQHGLIAKGVVCHGANVPAGAALFNVRTAPSQANPRFGPANSARVLVQLQLSPSVARFRNNDLRQWASSTPQEAHRMTRDGHQIPAFERIAAKSRVW